MNLALAITTGDSTWVKQALEHDSSLFYQPIDKMFGEIPIQAAIMELMPNIVKVITEVHQGSRFVYSRGYGFQTALMHVATEMYGETVLEMIDALNAANNLDATTPRVEEVSYNPTLSRASLFNVVTTTPPLYSLCERGMFTAAAHLLNISNAWETINYKRPTTTLLGTVHTRTSLWWATRYSDIDFVQLLLRYGADPFMCDTRYLAINNPRTALVKVSLNARNTICSCT